MAGVAAQTQNPSATVQMNTRLERRLKQEGDYALSLAGYSPSEAVRALWRLAASLHDDPSALRSALEGSGVAQGDRAEAEDPRLVALRDIRELERSTKARLGIADTEGFLTGSLPELRESYLVDRLADRDAHHV